MIAADEDCLGFAPDAELTTFRVFTSTQCTSYAFPVSFFI